MKNALTLICGISAALLLSGSAWGADGESMGQVPNPDKKFIENAVVDCKAQAELGQSASQKATDPAVRTFAGQMAEDNQKADDQLTRILGDKGIMEPESATLPTEAGDRLQDLSSTDYDRAYVKDTVKDCKKQVDNYKHEAADGKDPETRSYAAEQVPVLEEHLTTAEKTESSIQ